MAQNSVGCNKPNGPSKNMTIRVSVDDENLIREAAESNNESISYFVRRVVRQAAEKELARNIKRPKYQN